MNNYEKLAKIAVNKSLLKEYSNSSNDRIVYMDNDTEFQIQIFNPYNYIIGVSFSFNDNNNYGNTSLLVLRPGERVWLDRYLDKASKLLFSTYEVGNSAAVQEAIKDNGNLCIKFFKEQEKKDWGNNIYFYNYNNNNDYIKYCDSVKTYCNNDSAIRSLSNIDSINTPISCNFCSSITTTPADASLSFTSAASTASTAATSATYGATSSSNGRNVKIGTNSKVKSKIETGRIEEGGYSNQKFNHVNKDFEYWAFKTENIKILPSSQKPIYKNDLEKRYCHNCGRKLNQKYKFCPYCGTKL